MKARDVVEDASRPAGLTSFESKLLNLLALHLVQGRAQPEQIDLLTRAGFKPAEVGALLGTTANTVSVTLYQLKKTKKK